MTTTRKLAASALILDAESVTGAFRRSYRHVFPYCTIFYLPATTNDADITLAYLASTKRPVIAYGTVAIVLGFTGWQNPRDNE